VGLLVDLFTAYRAGDIQRSSDAQQRADLRRQAAQAIKEGFLDPLERRLAQSTAHPTN
jgi:hypothetical protein